MKNTVLDVPYGGLDAEKIRQATPVYNKRNLFLFTRYVIKRYRLHLCKDIRKLPPPWTDDPILHKYKFTNVRREHDRVTRHLLHLLEQHEPHDTTENVYMNIILYRIFSKIETSDMWGWINFQDDIIMPKFPPDFRPFCGAFMHSGQMGAFRKAGADDFRDIPRILQQNEYMILTAHIMAAWKPQQVIEALRKIPGTGEFMAYQIFVDLTYTKDFQFSENEFVMACVGSRQGLNFLFDDKGGLEDDELMFWLRDNFPIKPLYLKRLMVDLPMRERRMNVMSIENCLCEFAKYIKAYDGIIMPKIVYKGRKNSDVR